MANSKFTTLDLPLALIVIGLACVTGLSDFIERVKPPLPDGYSVSNLTMNGSRLRGYALGFEGLLADWYWARSLQYVGDKITNSKSDTINIDDLRELDPRLLYPMLQNATDLDPHFIAAYSYGAIVMPAIDPDQAIEIANKGIANNPNAWRLYQHLGYIYWKLGQFENAADAYEHGSKIEGAPPFLRLMAGAMKTQGGSRETARQIFTQMLADSQDEQTTITAQRRLQSLDAMDEIEAVNEALAKFHERNGRCASRLSEIFPDLKKVILPNGNGLHTDINGSLVDPTGAPYLVDAQKCSIGVDPAKTEIPVK